MPYINIQNLGITRESIHKAIDEFNKLGRQAFLDKYSKYGYGPAKAYFLVFDGHEFDSKVIIGVAHAFQFPEKGPLVANDFSGGPPVKRFLETLGFQVREVAVGNETAMSQESHGISKDSASPGSAESQGQPGTMSATTAVLNTPVSPSIWGRIGERLEKVIVPIAIAVLTAIILTWLGLK